MKLTPEEQKKKRMALAIVRVFSDSKVELESVKEAKELLKKLAQKEMEEETNKI